MNRDWLTSEEIVDFGVEPLPRDASTAVAGGRLVLYLNGFPRRGQLALTAVTSGQVLDWHREDRRRCSIHRPHLLTLGQICHYWLSEKEFVSVRWEARAQGPEPGAPIAIRLVARSYKLLE